MSADNYLHCWRLEDGRYAVQARSASAYYRDEGHTVESLRADFAANGWDYPVDESWLADGRPTQTFDTLADALAFVDKEEREEYFEYGVSFGEGIDCSRRPA